MHEPALTVTQLTSHVKLLVDRDEILQEVAVRGELANVTCHSSGHLYFTLRDAGSQLPCVCFRDMALTLTFQPKDGLAVIALGRVTVYERGGRYQLIARHLRPDGLGDRQAQFEALRARLEQEGLFAPERKRPLPRFPHGIALCTSPTGAAIRDLTTIIGRRFPLARMIVFPTVVQGEGAAPSIVASLAAAGAHRDVDVVIVGRGGGSLEDLWAFNEEPVARAVFACPKPVISAVGHETDVTISDMVADLRAATPSAAAELAVPEQIELLAGLTLQGHRLRAGLVRLAERARERLTQVESRTPMREPTRLLEPVGQRLDEAGNGLVARLSEQVRAALERCGRAGEKLGALGPLAVLERGYAIVRRAEDGAVVRSPAQAPVGAEVDITLAQGELAARITDRPIREGTIH